MDNFIGQIAVFGFNFPPRDWARCEGQTLKISEFQTLYAVIGTRYGGDGVTTFQLPDLRGRTPVNAYEPFLQGDPGGIERCPLELNQMPAHNHQVKTSATVDANEPSLKRFAAVNPAKLYTQAQKMAQLRPSTISNCGQGQGHENRQPSMALNFCICLNGLFPGRS